MPNAVLETTPPMLKSPDALVNARLADTYREWLKIANGRFAPTRREISPRNLKTVLPTAFLLDVIDDGNDFRLSLGGDKILRFLMNRLSPGMRLSEVSGSLFHQRAMRVMKCCVEMMQPVAAGPSQAVLEGREFFSTEVLVLPLSDDGEKVTSLLGAIHLGPLKLVEEPSEVAGMPTAFPGRFDTRLA
jgi:hypothetical protein